MTTLSQAEKRFLVDHSRTDPAWFWDAVLGCTSVYDKLGRLRVLCISSGSPVTDEITIQEVGVGLESRWTRCPECGCKIRVAGLKSKPRLTVHNAVNPR